MARKRKDQKPDELEQVPESEFEPAPDLDLAMASMPDDDFVRGSSKEEVPSTSSLGMHLWLYYPAIVQLPVEPTRKLAEVAQLRGLPNRKISMVDVVLQKSTRTLHIYPSADGVDDGYKVTYRSKGTVAEINVRTLFQPHGLTATKGWREKYPVQLEKETKFGPALVFTLTLNPERESVGSSSGTKSAGRTAKATGQAKATPPVTTGDQSTPEVQTPPPSAATDPTSSTSTSALQESAAMPKKGSAKTKKVDGGPPPAETM